MRRFTHPFTGVGVRSEMLYVDESSLSHSKVNKSFNFILKQFIVYNLNKQIINSFI